ncbi:MAG: hypothetical protein L3J12_01325 [Spirochaetales bacterium]|nr:hypothetical protein [Spirochaetales bacterium]
MATNGDGNSSFSASISGTTVPLDTDPEATPSSPSSSNPAINYSYKNGSDELFNWRALDEDGDSLIFKLYIAPYGQDVFTNSISGFPISINSGTAGASYYYESGYSDFSIQGTVIFRVSESLIPSSGNPSLYSWGVRVSDDGGSNWFNGTTIKNFGIAD